EFNNYYKLDIGSIENNILVQRDGSLSGYIYPDLSQDINEIRIKAIDSVGNQSINDVRTIYLVKKNTQYAVLKPENLKVNANDLVNIKVKVNNVSKAKEVLFKYKIDANLAKIIDVTVLSENIGNISIEYSISMDSDNYQVVSGKIKLLESISGEKELVNIKLENNSLNLYNTEISLEGSTSYTNDSGKTIVLDTIFVKYTNALESVLAEILPYWGEGLTYKSYSNIVPSLGSNYDYSNIGLNIKVKDNKGKEYPIIYNNDVNKFIAVLPLKEDMYTLTYDMPGHFIIDRRFTIDRVDDFGGGYVESIEFERVLAGDINKDNVIDINDAIIIRDNYLSTLREADINYDIIVDMKDMNYIIQNYLTKNPNIIDSPEPVEEKDGEVLQDVINSLKKTTIVSTNSIMNLKGESTQTTVILTWNEPDVKIGLTGYIIYREGKEIVNLRAGTVSYIVEGLKPNTIYGFKVVVKYVNGNVSKAISINIRTKK
ncbi:fibronectin type III domain-containing protein, partial [Clostridium sp.]|uniref:fibronectin type III domain-containing protein n=1 Tax=Clostridium sp. TaxID=1506 RepID=UPI003F2C935C